ncbi:MAG: hypothetical protein ACJAS4_002606 [Bacteriovoracaceae bacterium]|jgi:hypothetical protein
MSKNDNTQTNRNTEDHFNEVELAEIMSFIQENESETIERTGGVIDTDKVLNAWSQVRRKSLFGRQ